jgi:hypothetical protein
MRIEGEQLYFPLYECPDVSIILTAYMEVGAQEAEPSTIAVLNDSRFKTTVVTGYLQTKKLMSRVGIKTEFSDYLGSFNQSNTDLLHGYVEVVMEDPGDELPLPNPDNCLGEAIRWAGNSLHKHKDSLIGLKHFRTRRQRARSRELGFRGSDADLNRLFGNPLQSVAEQASVWTQQLEQEA